MRAAFISAFTAITLLATGLGAVPSVAAQQDTLALPDLTQPIRGLVKCENGRAKGFACRNVDLLSFLPMAAVGADGQDVILNDIWGWIDSVTRREFAVVGRSDGTAFVEVTNPTKPKYLGYLPLHVGANATSWRALKVYKNHAFIGADGAGPHGIQIFDLTQLRQIKDTPVEFQETAHYSRVNSVHSIVINEATGFMYSTGNSMGGESCGGALHMVDVRIPTRPAFAGCYADPRTGMAGTGYTHDAQCVLYHGPDTQYANREICLNASETAIGIADVTDKGAPRTISIATYPNAGYTHQGWLTADQRYLFVDDELDDGAGGIANTRTIVFDLNDLDDPIVLREFYGTTTATDHNLYINGRYMYQSNYSAGLRVIDIADPTNLKEVGYFDTFPDAGKNAAGFVGSWSNFPYFKGDVVGITSMSEGLFFVRHSPEK